jgi:hypothetical protein
MDDMAKKGNKKIMVVCHGFVSRSFLKVVTGAKDILALFNQITQVFLNLLFLIVELNIYTIMVVKTTSIRGKLWD